MAEDLIVHGAEEIVSRLISVAFDEIGLLVCVKRDAQSLQASLNSIHATLQDAEEKQVKEKLIRVWLEELKQVAYDVEDVFDEISYEQLRRSILINNKGCYYYFSSSFITRFALRFQLAHQIKAINLRLADIDSTKKRFNLQPTDDQNNASSSNPAVAAAAAGGIDRETTSFVDYSDVVGREDDKENIVRMLTNQEITSVIAIYGLGGLGKTTLAQLAYNDDAVRKHFDLRVWICVSDNFNTTNLFTQILEQIPDATKPQSSTKQVLENALKEQLMGKKFLLVLDDVWTEQQEKWEDFAPPLKNSGATGSKIIVTCRSHNVALAVRARAEDMYQLKGLSNDECWNIIQRRAFCPGGLMTCSRLEKIGREISKKCKGVPLVAKVLGGLLYSKKETEWLALQRAEIWNSTFEKEENYIIEVLKLSYNSLTPTLKSCFSYCAIFPKDYWISKELLIQLWMAQGFLEAPATQGESTMEDKGNTYLNSLYSKSFFQEAQMNKFKEIKKFKMHDLVQDLAQSICKSECQIVGEGNIMREDLSKCRHVSLMSPKKVEALDKAKKLRTFLDLKSDFDEELDNEGALQSIEFSTLFKFKLLRVLGLSGFKGCNFPSSSHCKLKHLRYRDLSFTSIESLPRWVTRLFHLQTLKLLGCEKLTELPEDLKNLKKLRHLFVDEYGKWKKMPQAIGELHQLQTLPIFVASKEDAGRGMSMLERLSSLGGTFDIHCLCHVKEASLAKGANILGGKRNLRKLRLHWERPSSVGDHESDDSLVSEDQERSCISGGVGDELLVLEALRPHANLQWLSIEGFGGVEFPSWVSNVSDLPNLEGMELSDCNHCEDIPSFSGLRGLKWLMISFMSQVKHFGVSKNGCVGTSSTPPLSYRSMKKLELRCMINLEEWLEGDGVMFPSLEELSIENCPNLSKTPQHVFPSLKSLKLENVGGMGVVSITSSLTSLTSLKITECKDLEFLQEGLVSNNSQLNTVLIRDCPKLQAFREEGLASASAAADEILPNRFLCKMEIDESDFSYASKGVLRISNCPELESIGKGFLSSLVFLESLNVQNCGELKYIELSQSLNHLRELQIKGCPNFEGLKTSTTELGKLCFYNCGNLRQLPSKEQMPRLTLPSLRQLVIIRCEGLQGLQGLQFLTALENLQLGPFSEELNDFPFALESNNPLILPSLRHLSIEGWAALQSLPHQLQRLTTLKSLYIWNFSQLTELPEWLGNLTSLEELRIYGCENLRHLPSKEQMHRLTFLEELAIRECPRLKERCSREWEGDDPEWPKISHIPHLIL
ncbi:hypothetical protein Sjap_008174 [Stephania japonica]|uniref:Uncharacterized protein n=1 Tax=Stephania japonica TaxID=461633 RepID=A0AAP0JR89_9MAGN